MRRTDIRARVQALVAALLAGLALAAAAQDADVVARAEQLVRGGRYAEAYQLLEPLEDKLAGDLKFDYLLARSALETGRPSKASFVYERILATEPNFVGVRLEMGRAYLALGDYSRAKLEFETVLRFDNLPPDIREQALIYARAADQFLAGKRTVGYAYAEYGIGYDTNPLSATGVTELTLQDGTTVPVGAVVPKRSAWYQTVTLGGELVHALSDRFSVYAGGDTRARWYNDFSTANFVSVDGRVGLGYSEGRSNARLGVLSSVYWLDSHHLRDTYGLTGDWRYLATNVDQISFSATGLQLRFVPDAIKINNFNLYQGGIGWLRSVNDGRGTVGLTLLGGYEDATGGRADGNLPFFGAQLSFQNAFTDSLGAFLFGGAQGGKYSLTTQNLPTRRDTLYNVTAGLTWSFGPGWSLRPQVIYQKNDSNISFYAWDRTDVSINLRKDF